MSNAKHNRNADPNKFEPWLHRYVPPRLHAEARRAWSQGWRVQLAWVKKNMLNMRDDGTARVGIKTQENRSQVLQQAFTQLRALGFKIENILSFNQKHLIALFTLWYEDQAKPGTIADRRSILSVFCNAIGKGGMVPSVKDFNRLGLTPAMAKRTTVAREDKSWGDEQYAEASKEAYLRDPKYGRIVDMMLAYGLRGKEGYMLEPHLADCGTHLHLTHGTKNGRERDVPIDTPEKRQILDRCKIAVLDKSDSISGKSRGLRATRDWYKRMNAKIGATLAGKIGKTPHGLRHTFAHDELMKRGVPVAVKGEAGKVPADAPKLSNPEKRVARKEVAEAMGHSRISVTGAYAGSLRAVPTTHANIDASRAARHADPAEQQLTPDAIRAKQLPDKGMPAKN